MKKLIMAALVAVASVSANAQYWAGGEVGFNTSRTSLDGHTLGKENQVTLAPEVGYKLNDKWDVAVKLEYEHVDEKHGTNANGFAFNPYVRYTYFKSGKFTAFIDGGFSYGFIHESGVDDNLNQWQIALNPGISYGLTDKVGLVAHVGDLSWTFAKQGDVKNNTFDLGVTNAITFGAYVNF